MAIHLTIIKSPPASFVAEERKSFGSAGGMIGRGADNDWVLPDPERFLSSRHCQISKDGGRYFLTDLSTNGTFVNGSHEPLGRGARIVLNDGESFDVGDYRFKVAIEQDTPAPSASPFAESTPFNEHPDVERNNDIDLFGSTQADPAAIFMSNEYTGSVADITPDAMKINDPLIALDAANQRGALDDPFAGDPFAGGSQEDSANLLQESVNWPETKEESRLPDDWGDDISLLGPRKGAAASYTLPDDDALIVKTPSPDQPQPFSAPESPQPAPEVPATRPEVPAMRPEVKVPTPRPKPKPRSPMDTASGAPGNLQMDRSLVDALGFEGVELSDEHIREIHGLVGSMMRETIDGLMQVLRSRTSIKNEFRINVTTIQPVENNPIKFSANVDEALETMFLRRSRAYKEPVAAIQESFDSIADHQVAVLAGIRSAFRSSLGKFDPVQLEEEFKQTGKSGLMSGVLKGKMWSAYQEYYQGVAKDVERSFHELFGDEFVQAYEEQMGKLSNARKRDI